MTGKTQGGPFIDIKADITGKPVLTMENEAAACQGAAIVVGKGVGLFPSLEDATAQMVRIKGQFDPNPANEAVYALSFEKYVRLYESLADLFSREEAV